MSEENKALMRRFFQEIFEKGNVAAADQFIDSNCINHAAMPGQAPDREGIKQGFTMLLSAFPNVRITVEDEIAEGDKVVNRLTARAIHRGEFMGVPATGKEVTLTGIGIHRFAGGKIVEHWDAFDMLGLMQQLGAVPTPGQSGG